MYYNVSQVFGFTKSIELLNMVVLGGDGQHSRHHTGSGDTNGLPEFLRVVADYRLLFYGALLVVLMIFRPNGILGDVRIYDIKKRWKKNEVAKCQS
jgi:branched-chain amino acid transport system permease protein